jgi:hypothetical protein
MALEKQVMGPLLYVYGSWAAKSGAKSGEADNNGS